MRVADKWNGKRCSLVAVAFLAGFFGLSYEILLTRIVSTFFGSVFYVAAAVLTAFLIGVGIASFLTRGRYRAVGFIELGIATIACVYGVGFMVIANSSELIAAIMPQGNILLSVTAGIVVLLPSSLIGFSLPMLMNLSKAVLGHSDDSLSGLFSAYNLGAVLCVLVVEFFAIREIGISSTLLVVGGCNLLVALHLIRVVRSADVPSIGGECAKRVHMRKHLAARPATWGALFVSSMAFGAFQIVALKVSGNLWGQTISTVGAILVSVLLGSAIGAKLSTKYAIDLKECLLASSLMICVWGFLLAPAGTAWAHVAPMINEIVGPYGAFLAQGIMIVLITAPCYIFMGPTEIAAIKDDEGAEELYGVSVGITSMGNALGMVGYVILVAPMVPDALAIACLGLLSALCWGGLAVQPKKEESREYAFG